MATRRGQYDFNRMPFGLRLAPATFQKLMHLIAKKENLEQCLIYLDDVLIFGNSCEQHFTRLKSVLSRIAKAGVKLKPDKCNFLQRKVSYFGYVISGDGIKTDPKKIEKVVNWETLGCYADLHSFIAFCNYYRQFIRDFASISQSVENLLKQDTGKINRKFSKFFVI